MRRGARGALRRALGVGLGGLAFQLLPPLLPPILPPILPPDLPGGAPNPLAPQISGVRAVTTGDHSERLRTVPITRRAGAGRRSVISLRAEDLGRLQRRDELRVSAELQVSTTCVDPSPRCHGRRYSFNPVVAARLVLAPSARAHSPRRTAPISGWRKVRCWQQRPNRNHHCMLVFPRERKRIATPRRLPCKPRKCSINLVARAHHPRARPGNVLVIGGDEAGGRIAQDRGRVNVIRIRRTASAAVRTLTGGKGLARTVPVLSGARQVVQSLPLTGLRKNERLEVRGSFVAALRRLPYNALVSSNLIVAPTPRAIHPGEASRIISSRGLLSEINGFNCTRGRSGYETPCRVVKVGLGRVKRAPAALLGPAATLYVNLIARSQPKLGHARAGHRLRTRSGRLVVTRYRPTG